MFACKVARAIHLELVESLDSDSFINALPRSINTTGRPNAVVSGCNYNFKGVIKKLKFNTQTKHQMDI